MKQETKELIDLQKYLNKKEKRELWQEFPFLALFDDSLSFSEWILENFYIPETQDKRITLADYQIKAIDRATSKSKNGLFNYSLIVFSDLKKSAKSTIAAAVALRFAFTLQWGSIKIVANDLKQAQSRSYYYLVRALSLNPYLKAMQYNGDMQVNRYTVKLNFSNTIIEAVPVDPRGEAGGNDDLIVWTEAWAAKSKAHQTMWTEMVISPGKFGKGFKWVESYAGFSGNSPILEPLYLNNVKPEYKIDKEFPFYKNDRTFVLWNQIPRLPWQTKEYYAQQTKELTDSEFKRVHRNEWQSSTQKFIPDIHWQQCQTELQSLKPKEKLILAVDVGLSDDYFALIGVNKIRGKIAVRVVRIWKPTKGKKLLFTNPTSDKRKDVEYPTGFIKTLAKQYKILVVRYDPYQAEKLAEDMVRNRICNWESFSQLAEREKADSYLYRLIRDRDIIHADNSELTQHIKNADAQHKGENRLRIVKRSQSLKVDLAVALSMAVYTVKDYNI